ncbi:MAG: class I SAM-dependent methyltransferase [Candidatus Coatesbacteria bacterium]|nr:MAG: class I SAM-dependent methyltransferase [Candidatus Coatesbacteria bacterium]
MRTSPAISEACLDAVYGDRYYAFEFIEERQFSSLTKSVLSELYGYDFRRSFWLRTIIRIFSPILKKVYYRTPRCGSPGRLLDVGSGAGDFVKYARDLGWDAVGTDPSNVAVEKGLDAGLDIRKVRAEELSEAFPAGEKFDVITFHHSLEHTAEPIKALKEAAKLATLSARIIATVPNAGGLMARLFGADWYYWSVPSHYYHFDKTTLHSTFRRAGLKPVKTYFASNYRGLNVSLVKRAGGGDKIILSPIASLISAFVLFFIDGVGLGDNMTVESVTN